MWLALLLLPHHAGHERLPASSDSAWDIGAQTSSIFGFQMYLELPFHSMGGFHPLSLSSMPKYYASLILKFKCPGYSISKAISLKLIFAESF